MGHLPPQKHHSRSPRYLAWNSPFSFSSLSWYSDLPGRHLSWSGAGCSLGRPPCQEHRIVRPHHSTKWPRPTAKLSNVQKQSHFSAEEGSGVQEGERRDFGLASGQELEQSVSIHRNRAAARASSGPMSPTTLPLPGFPLPLQQQPPSHIILKQRGPTANQLYSSNNFLNSTIHSLGIYWAPTRHCSSGETAVKKADKNPCPQGTCSLEATERNSLRSLYFKP